MKKKLLSEEGDLRHLACVKCAGWKVTGLSCSLTVTTDLMISKGLNEEQSDILAK